MTTKKRRPNAGGNVVVTMSKARPSMGPNPTLIGRTQVDALYSVLQAVVEALISLEIPYIITGGSLLGAARQHSILFCDDDVDIAIVGRENYEKASQRLSELLGKDYRYSVKPWQGGDKVRLVQVSNVFVDVFCIRNYENESELRAVIGVKENGQAQSEEYVQNILQTMQQASVSQNESLPLYPCWHFDTRKAIELWPKEVYREHELFPLVTEYKMGPIVGISGPRMPVLLLKRAFGQDCFDVYYQSHSHHDATMNDSSHHQECNNNLKPLVAAGGTWEHNVKTPLLQEHYIPMQPLAKAKRRPTLHDKEQLMAYLSTQSTREEAWMREVVCDNVTTTCIQKQQEQHKRPRRTVYMDGVFDLFHVGHLNAIRQCAELGDCVIIGVTGTEDASSYKRPPIVPQQDRIAIVQAIEYVNKVICPCPLVVTEEFMQQHDIDLVVHGFANDEDAKRQEEFFSYPIQVGKFQQIDYYKDLSTTDIITKIQALDTNDDLNPPASKWFGASLAKATKKAPEIPYDPFPLYLRTVIEPHIEKARVRRRDALSVIREASNDMTKLEFDRLIHSPLEAESDFDFDIHQYSLRSALLKCTNFPMDTDLSQLHINPMAKDTLLQALTNNFSKFQAVYDDLVLSICAPRVVSLLSGYSDDDRIYYQAFPCIRIVQPGEFSIGPHADVAYGHHPCSVNFYVPLTQIGGTASLFLESRLGSEDWHAITGDYGHIKQFAGATCLHFTPENMTDYTRVSLDFRLIPGSMMDALKSGVECVGGQVDAYRRIPGYYSCCRRGSNGIWQREGRLLSPDARVGFPWTVKDWDKYYEKKQQRQQLKE